MEPNVQRNDEIEIDLLGLMKYLLQKAWLMLLCGMVCAVIAAVVTNYYMTPMYTSRTSFYVMNRQANDTITTSDISSSTSLTNDYVELIKSRSVIDTVIEDLNLDMTYNQLLSSISVSVTSGTRVVKISIVHADPQMAANIADQVREVAAMKIQEVMKVDSVSVVDAAFVPAAPSSPNLKKNVMLAAMLGIFLAAAVVVVRYLLNDKITTSDDVEKYLGISVIGMIPIDENLVKTKKARKKAGKGKH